MKRSKITSSAFNSTFSHEWRIANTKGLFEKDALNCKEMIFSYKLWRIYCLLSIIANVACFAIGAVTLYMTKDSVILFRLFGVLYVCIQGILCYNIFWLTKGEGSLRQEEIPGKTARDLAVAWDAFVKEVKEIKLLDEVNVWMEGKKSNYLGQNEMVDFFQQTLYEKGRLIVRLEDAGKEEEKEKVRSKMSKIYDIAKTLKLDRKPFKEYFVKEVTVCVIRPTY
jgi:hypothetical protein